MNQKAFKDLDDANVEIERLLEELSGTTDSLDNLKRSHNEKLNEIREAKLKIEKMDTQILQKESQIKEANQLCENFRRDLSSKESIIKDLTAENEKLRAKCNERFRLWEQEKKELALELGKANEKLGNQELQLTVFKQEIESLEWLLEASNKKYMGTGKTTEASGGGEEGNNMYQQLEEVNMKEEEQLKCKREQFKQLQGVHEQLKGEFNSTMRDWEMEKATLLYQISSLQGKLVSQMKISEDLQNQLQICRQALASAEESQRKREKESPPRAEELYLRESKLENEKKQEQENPRLQTSLREIQDGQVQETGQYSLSRLRSDLRVLEQIHRECVSKFKARQAEWNFQLERSTQAITNYRSQLVIKTAEVEDLKMELEGSHSFSIEMMMQNEELSVTLLVLKREIYEAKSKPFSQGNETGVIYQSREERLNQLMKQFEMKSAAMIGGGINGECDTTTCLMRQVDSCSLPLDLQNFQSDEIDRHRDMMDLLDAWDMVLNESDETLCEINEIEYELQVWKSFAERLKNDLDENFVKRKELENSLLAQVEFSETLKQERDSLVGEVKEKTRSIAYLQECFLRFKAMQGEAASVICRAESIEEKDMIFEDVQNKVGLMAQPKELEKYNPMEDEFRSSQASFSPQYATEQAEIYLLREACARITAAEVLAALEVEEKKLMIAELEGYIRRIEKKPEKPELQEENCSQIEQLALEKRNLQEKSTMLSSEKEILLSFVLGLSGKLCDECTLTKDTKLMEMLRTIVKSFEKDRKGDDALLVKENMKLQYPTGIKESEIISDIYGAQ
ncbi:hypothetical protein PIB30_012156 [Stylosanthes scabra]|uniref:Uncharacterized protein n=1 Tax=Stylosanthes scabra TaxID=79078 RepID=A0ABU6T5R7_9FABA|nr:hypothetical protein [Stylosanthes scabra]